MFEDNGPLWLLMSLGVPVGISVGILVRELRLHYR